MTVKTIQYPGTDTGKGQSGAIWEDCPFDQIRNGEKAGMAFYDTFDMLPLAPTLTTQVGWGPYKAYAASSNTIIGVNTINSVVTPGGYMKTLEGANTAADCISLGQSYGSYYLSGSPSTSGKLWFECRIADNAAATANVMSWFFGLAEVDLFTLANNVPFTSSAGAISASGAFIGFNKLMAQTIAGQINTVYTDRATSWTVNGSNEASLSSTAYTFTKLGFVYTPNDKNGNSVTFYQNGAPLATKVTNAVLTATTYLCAKPLGLLFSVVAGTAKSATDAVFLDWWQIAQLQPTP
jgi:hypothetical protein